MAPPRKAPERRQRRNTPEIDKALTPVAVAHLMPLPAEQAPEPSEEWLPLVAEEWSELWASDLSSRIQQTDLPAVRRLFDWRNRQHQAQMRVEVLRDRAIEEPMVPGSKGQPVANPLFAAAEAAAQEALSIEGRIVALEDRLGLTPKARLGLGVTEQKGFSLAAANAQVAQAMKEAMAGATDPRALPGDTAADAG